MQLTPPLITALIAGLCGLLSVVLAARVSIARGKHKVGIGDGDNKEMLQAIRAHANNAEYTPLGLVVLALIETLGAPSIAVWVIGGCLLVGRLAHAQGIISSSGTSPGRLVGTVLSWLSIALACLYAIYFGIKAF